MGVGSIIVFILVGIVEGWMEGKVVKGGGLGMIGNIIVGVIGDLFEGWMLKRIGF